MRENKAVKTRKWFVWHKYLDYLAVIEAASQTHAAEIYAQNFKNNFKGIEFEVTKSPVTPIAYDIKYFLKDRPAEGWRGCARIYVNENPSRFDKLSKQLISRFRYEILHPNRPLPLTILLVLSYIPLYFKTRV